MRPEDVPQEGDLLLYFELGRRAEKYFAKQADGGEWNLPLGLGKVPTPGAAFDQAKSFGQERVLNPIVDAATERAKGNFGLGNVGKFFEDNPGAYAPLIGAGVGLGAGLLGSSRKKKNQFSSALTGGLLGAGAGGLLWGAGQLWGGGATPPPAEPAKPPDAPAAPTAVSGGRDLTQPNNKPLLQQAEEGASAVADSATLTPQTNAAIDGPLKNVKDLYQTFRPGVRGSSGLDARNDYDAAFSNVVEAEKGNDYQKALDAAKTLHGLNQSHGHMVSNNLKAPDSSQLAGLGGLAAAGVPAGKPLDFRLFGAPMNKTPGGLQLGDDSAQLASRMTAAKGLQPLLQSTNDDLAAVDPGALGKIDPARSPLGRASLEYGLGGAAAGQGLQKVLDRFGYKSGPDSRYWSQLERGMTGTGAAPGRSWLNPRLPISNALFGSQLDPATINDRAVNQLMGVVNQNRSGAWETPASIRAALTDPKNPNHGAMLQAVRDLSKGTTGDPTEFRLDTLAGNQSALKDLTKRLPPVAKGQQQAATADLIAQLRGTRPLQWPTESALLSADSPLGNMSGAARIVDRPGGPVVRLQQPTYATTYSEAIKKQLGNALRSKSLLGGLIGSTIPVTNALTTGQRVTTTPLEKGLGLGPGGLDLGDPKVVEARKQDLLRKLMQLPNPGGATSANPAGFR